MVCIGWYLCASPVSMHSYKYFSRFGVGLCVGTPGNCVSIGIMCALHVSAVAWLYAGAPLGSLPPLSLLSMVPLSGRPITSSVNPPVPSVIPSRVLPPTAIHPTNRVYPCPCIQYQLGLSPSSDQGTSSRWGICWPTVWWLEVTLRTCTVPWESSCSQLTLDVWSWIIQTCHRDALLIFNFGHCSNLATQTFAVIC